MDTQKIKIRKAVNELLKLRSNKKQCRGQIRDAEWKLIRILNFQEYEFNEIKTVNQN